MPIHIERDDELGVVRIMSDVACLAHTKSRIIAARIRDALNAPKGLIGQVVRRGTGELGKLGGHVGVVQKIAWSNTHVGFILLVRVDQRLEEWEAESCAVVEMNYSTKDTYERGEDTWPAGPSLNIQRERDRYRQLLERLLHDAAHSSDLEDEVKRALEGES